VHLIHFYNLNLFTGHRKMCLFSVLFYPFVCRNV
jgi:hypothetical protein